MWQSFFVSYSLLSLQCCVVLRCKRKETQSILYKSESSLIVFPSWHALRILHNESPHIGGLNHQ